MRERLSHLWEHHRLALIAFATALTLVGYFAITTILATIYWMDPAHQDQTLAEWMTPRYVAQSYQLPPEVLGPALFLVKGEPPRRKSIGTIAAENGLTLQQMQDRIDAAAFAHRILHPVRR